MFLWILQSTIISIILIVLVHYLFSFFKSTLTIPKIKDLVHKPNQKYEDMIDTIQSGRGLSTMSSHSDTSSMKSELKNFLNDLNTGNVPKSVEEVRSDGKNNNIGSSGEEIRRGESGGEAQFFAF